MKFRNAIVKKPSKKMVDGISTANLGKPDYSKALKQHQNYIKTLKECEVQVEILNEDESHPDSMFVEDPAIVTDKCAIITNLGAESRKGEEKEIKKALKKYFSENIHEIKAPGTLEGGDVMQVEDHFYIGISERTNKNGAKQLLKYLEKYNYSGTIVEFKDILHLKTGIAYIGDNTMVATDLFIDKKEFEKFDKIRVDDSEEYAANCIRVNDYVILPKGYSNTKKSLIQNGFEVKIVDVSEFRKLDGGLSCLSLRF